MLPLLLIPLLIQTPIGTGMDREPDQERDQDSTVFHVTEGYSGMPVVVVIAAVIDDIR